MEKPEISEDIKAVISKLGFKRNDTGNPYTIDFDWRDGERSAWLWYAYNTDCWVLHICGVMVFTKITSEKIIERLSESAVLISMRYRRLYT